MDGSLLKAIQVLRKLRKAVGDVSFHRNKKPYEGVQFNVIRVTRAWVGQISRKKTLRPLNTIFICYNITRRCYFTGK